MKSDIKLSVHGGPLHTRTGDTLVVGVLRTSSDEEPKTTKKKTASKKAPSKKAGGKPGGDQAALAAQLGEIDRALDGLLSQSAAAEGFRGDADQTFAMHTLGKLPVSRVVLMGLGPKDKLSAETFRRLGGRAVREAGSRKAERVVLALPEADSVNTDAAAGAAVEGALLGLYRFDRYLTKNSEPPSVKELEVIADLDRARAKRALDHARAVADGVSLARDLVNECPGALTPEQFAKEARRVGKDTGLDVRVLTEKEIEKEKMGMMLAVSKAALPYTPPRLVRLHYKPTGKAKKKIALVGKGLTFDSGGLDIKPAAGMLDMKIDMSGAAAVLGTMLSIGRIRPDVEVTAYLGCVENGIGGNAYHPGDVLRSRKGLTVEVNNTDAEGRLVLADCIDYALTTDKPDVLIDLATLTGACMVALGPTTAGLFSSDDELAEDIRNAGKRAGEDFWRMPLNEDLMGQLKSPIADMRNTGERYGGAITAALFLKQFVDDRARWAHLDIAGPAATERESDYTAKGGVGFGVRTLVGVIAPV